MAFGVGPPAMMENANVVDHGTPHNRPSPIEVYCVIGYTPFFGIMSNYPLSWLVGWVIIGFYQISIYWAHWYNHCTVNDETGGNIIIIIRI
jgi:hypothetical protein